MSLLPCGVCLLLSHAVPVFAMVVGERKREKLFSPSLSFWLFVLGILFFMMFIFSKVCQQDFSALGDVLPVAYYYLLVAGVTCGLLNLVAWWK